MLGVTGTGELVNIRGYKIKTAIEKTNEITELCGSGAVVFISDKGERPSLYYNIKKNTTGCLVSSRYLNNYPECAAKEQTSLAEALERDGNLMNSGGNEYYNFNPKGQEAASKDCNKELDPGCSK